MTVRLAVVTAIVCAFLIAPASTRAAQASPCVVTPDPVSLSLDSSWTVTAQNGTPGALYEVLLQEGGVPRQDEGTTIDRVYADDVGTVTDTFQTLDYRLSGLSNFYPSLIPGTAKLKVRAYRTGGGTGGKADLLATCSFGVTE
jgi:hypothetical protein